VFVIDKGECMSNLDRRKFFNKISLGALGLMIFSTFPLNLLGQKKRRSFKNIKIKLNPHSVKRNK